GRTRRPGPGDPGCVPAGGGHRGSGHPPPARAAAAGPGHHPAHRSRRRRPRARRPARPRGGPVPLRPRPRARHPPPRPGPGGGGVVVWSRGQLPDELRTVGTLLALDSIWRSVDAPGRARLATRRLVVVDEAWLLMRDGEGARFLCKMSKAGRKRNAGLTVVTQDVADVLGTDLGQAVVSNAATQVLLKQAPQAIDAVADAFGLTVGER